MVASILKSRKNLMQESSKQVSFFRSEPSKQVNFSRPQPPKQVSFSRSVRVTQWQEGCAEREARKSMPVVFNPATHVCGRELYYRLRCEELPPQYSFGPNPALDTDTSYDGMTTPPIKRCKRVIEMIPEKTIA